MELAKHGFETEDPRSSEYLQALSRRNGTTSSILFTVISATSCFELPNLTDLILGCSSQSDLLTALRRPINASSGMKASKTASSSNNLPKPPVPMTTGLLPAK